jgi:hypothetical protein
MKLDDFSNFVYAQRPGEHGTALMFDETGMLLAHPDFAQFVKDAMTHPSHPQLFSIKQMGGGLAASVLKAWNGGDQVLGEDAELRQGDPALHCATATRLRSWADQGQGFSPSSRLRRRQA